MLEKIIDFVFPNICGICGEKINERYTCRKCLNILKCYKEKIYYPSCDSKYYIDKIISAFNYNGLLKSKMLQFKFHNNKYIAKTFGDILSYKISNHKIDVDIIIPVPICKERYFDRGYNQSEYIAKYVSELSGITLVNDVLKKDKNNKQQSLLDKSKREENVKDVYSVKNSYKVINKKVLLLDDIYTTGATLNECSKVLKKAGAKNIVGITVLYSDK